MKFHWFAEVTYPHLSPGVLDRFDSSWVDLPRRLYDPELGRRVYDDFLEEYAYADVVGFDGIAVNEHHQSLAAVTPSPNLLAAILARTTRRAALLVLGNSLPLYNPPIRVAEELAMLDVLSNGRVVAGLVLGTVMDSVYCYGMPPAELRARWREAHDLILRSWQESEPFAFTGEFTSLPCVNVWPRTVQQPRPPVWVPGLSSVETWEIAAAHDHCYGHFSFSGHHKAKAFVDGYWEFIDRVGADANPHRFAFSQVICVAETDALAEKEYGAAVEYFFRYADRVAPRFSSAPGYQSERSKELVESLMRRAGPPPTPSRPAGEMRFGDYVERGSVVAGSPATVRERLRELAADLRIGQLICLLQIGNLGKEATLRNTHLFATEVAPFLRDLHAEHEDRWTPKARQPVQAAAGAPLP